jgi:hypothetical protein
MNKKQLASNLIFAGGITELLVAALHFLMPLAIGQASEINSLQLDYRNYVFHATLAIGLCMTVFGTLSIYFSRKMLQGEQAAWVFGLSQATLWIVRTVSELVLPVRIPLFFLSNPTTVILPMVIVIALLFLVPTLILLPGRQGQS